MAKVNVGSHFCPNYSLLFKPFGFSRGADIPGFIKLLNIWSQSQIKFHTHQKICEVFIKFLGHKLEKDWR